ncbi:MAG: tetratricopeptide repeat protein, partial [Candidatus Gastranaerophilales bacterium]|nr:tetratricopeptide repeat protein [Candidatus Gastranaerophilales bacterium]
QVKNDIAYIKTKRENYENLIKNTKIGNKYSEFLKSGPFITSDDEEIKKVAQKLKQDNLYNTAKALEKWVYENINDKSFSVNFANSREVLKTKKGDCSEHAVLLMALLRASEIPCQAVGGLMYSAEPFNAFSYHMWVKAYVGQWIYLDPSFDEKTFSPLHLSMTETPLNDLSDRADLSLSVLNSLSKIKIKIINSSKASEKSNVIGQNQAFNFLSLLGGTEDFSHKVNLSGNPDNVKEFVISTKKQEDYTRSGFFEFSQGNIEAAIENFSQAINLIKFNDTYADIQFARKMASLGLFSMSDKILEKTYDKDIWTIQIQTIKDLYYPKAIDDKPEKTLAKVLSTINFEKNADKAINLLNENQKAFEKNDYANYLYAKAYIEQKDYKKAFEYLKTAIKTNPENQTYKLEIAKVLIEFKEYKTAQKILEYLENQKICDSYFEKELKKELFWIKSKDRNEFDSMYYLAKYYALNGDFSECKLILNKIQEKFPENSDLYAFKGDISYKLNDFDSALENYENSLKFNKRNKKSIRGIANLDMLKGEYNKALNGYKNALKYDKNSVEILLNIAKTYQILSYEKDAYETYLEILKLDETNLKANYELALINLQDDNKEIAINLLKKTLSINPDYFNSWLKLAEIEISNDNYFLAKSYLIPLQHINSQIPQYYYLTGLIAKKNENYTSARNNFKKAIEIRPNYYEAKQELDNLK